METYELFGRREAFSASFFPPAARGDGPMPLLRRLGLLIGFLLTLTVCATANAQEAEREADSDGATLYFDMPSQELASALNEFSVITGRDIVFNPDLVAGLEAPALQGDFTPAEAVARLLAGTGLVYRRMQSGTYAVMREDGAAAAPVDDPPFNDGSAQASAGSAGPKSGIEEIIVTGQKKSERIQDVPIAISAFSQDDLDAQKLEGGFDLLKAIPNVTFSKSNFSGYNFQIRGIGTQAISATTDPGVAVSMNNTTLIVNRLFEQEYLDVERVEVLRGPQGTLFGRNATAGVINVITNKPEMGVHEGMIDLEVGNYGAERLRGHLNVPLYRDSLAMRLAYASTERDGYGTNQAADDFDVSKDLDNRDLWTGRFSLGWQPNDVFRADFIYERFEEDDNRLRTSKQLCHHDEGNTVGGERITEINPDIAPNQLRSVRSQVSQGCLPRSLFDGGDPGDPDDNGAFGIPNGDTIPFIRGLRARPQSSQMLSDEVTAGAGQDLLLGGAQTRDLRSIYTPIEPQYEASSDYYELSMDYELPGGLTLSSQTVYMENALFSTQDFLRFQTRPGSFVDSTTALEGRRPDLTQPFHKTLTPGGIFDDPQLGPSDRILLQDVSQQDSEQFSTELRLASSFGGPLNFSLGANYTRFETVTDYFVFSNALSLLARSSDVFAGTPVAVDENGELLGAPEDFPDAELAMLAGSPLAAGGQGSGLTTGCGTHFDPRTIERDTNGDILSASCVYMQPGSIGQVTADPEGHHFFLSRNPYELDSAGIFGELYYDITPTLKLTAGLRLSWDRKTFTPIPSQTMLPSWEGRFQAGFLGGSGGLEEVPDNITAACDPPETGIDRLKCASSGNTANGSGYPAQPDIVQEWRVPTGRIGLDWQPLLPFTDETLVYAFYNRGYKAGGANPPSVAPPQGLLIEEAQGAAAPATFEPEYVNAYEVGTKNTLFGGALTLNGSAFYYDYKDYQVSKIVDRSAANENFDAKIWGLELETVFAPTLDTVINANIGYLRTRVEDGEESLDLMDRTQGGGELFITEMENPNFDPSLEPRPESEYEASTFVDLDGSSEGNFEGQGTDAPADQEFLAFDEWMALKPNFLQASNCVAPTAIVREFIAENQTGIEQLSKLCPGGGVFGASGGRPAGYNPATDAPNGSAGFFADIGGNELPGAPRFTVSLGAQHTYHLPGGQWSATGRVDWYWQDESYHRVYNTEFDRLESWTNTNLSFWVTNARQKLTVEAYVKNVFDRTPVTGAFLNSDDTGLTTNVFTLDPRLIGVSIRKEF